MGIYITILEQGLIYGILALEVLWLIRSWISGSDSRWKLSAGSRTDSDDDHKRRSSNPDTAGIISDRCACRSLHRPDSCKIQGKRSLIRNYHDDSIVDDQLKTGRNSKCPDLWRGQYL